MRQHQSTSLIGAFRLLRPPTRAIGVGQSDMDREALPTPGLLSPELTPTDSL